MKIKMREGFRTFAPSVIEEDCQKYFDLEQTSPYMLLVAPVQEEIQNGETPLPSITHVDGSARVQTVNSNQEPLYYELLQTFKKKTGCSVLINTSMNVRGEPIVNTPEDAYRCFMRTKWMAFSGPFLLHKKINPS